MKLYRCAMDGLALLYTCLHTGATSLALVTLGVLVLAIVADVLIRLVFFHSLQNVNEMSGYLFVAIIFMGAACTHRRDMHIRVPIAVDRLPTRVRQQLYVAMEVICLIYVGLVLVWLAMAFSIQSYHVGNRSPTSLAAPLWVPQMLIPVGSAIFLIEIVRQLIHQIRGFPKKLDDGEDQGR